VIAKKLGTDRSKKYHGVSGMIILAKELTDDDMETNLGLLYCSFGGSQSKEVISALTNIPVNELEGLCWENINLPYKRLVSIGVKLANNPKKYYGISGMIILAKELTDESMETNLGQLYRGFGGIRGKEVISTLTKIPIKELEDLCWEKIDLPYSRLVVIAKKLANDKEKNYHGIPGMISLAKELAEDNIETNLGQLYSGFGGSRGKTVISILTGSSIDEIEDLSWEDIALSCQHLVTIAQKLAGDKENKYQGVAGMLILAKELTDDDMATNLGRLYRGFWRLPRKRSDFHSD
jgi:glutamine amidotransferase PdxT